MHRKLNYCRFVLCKKPHEKKTYWTRNNTFSKSIKNGHFWPNSKGGTKGKFSKLADCFGPTSESYKNRKYKSYNGLTSMDRKLHYCRFVLCKILHEKRPSRRVITLFLKVSKMAIFGQIAKGGPREIFQKWPIFWSNFGRLKKHEIQVVQWPN